MRAKSVLAASTLSALGLALALGALAQQGQFSRKVIQKHDLQAADREGTMAYVEIHPGAREGRHTHPGEVFAYVLEGTMKLAIDGQPTETHTAGESFFIPAGKIHEGINDSTAMVKIVAVFATEKGKPLTTQVK
jgi:quercetin dioxygenase-like cupin family protein